MDDTTNSYEADNFDLTAEIIMAYVSNNSVPASELPALIGKVHTAVLGLTGDTSVEASTREKLTPAQIKKSITPDALISFEDGKPYKTLRRHLTIRGLTPETYRAKHGLSVDYPMTSAAYSAQRSELARNLGLGRKGSTASSSETSQDGSISDDAAPAKRRGRPPGSTKALVAARSATAFKTRSHRLIRP